MANPDSTTQMKRCTKCGTELPATLEYFCARKDAKSGFVSWCRDCQRENSRRWYVENTEHVREKSRQWHSSNPDKARDKNQKWKARNRDKTREQSRRWRRENREKALEKTRRWYAENTDRARELNRIWRTANPDRFRELNRRWYIENPERVATKNRNRRARLRDAEGAHTAADIAAQLKRQRGKCYYCGVKMIQQRGKPNSQTVDHVVPLDKGGRNSPDNLVIACLKCNCSKQDKLPHEWTQGGRLI